MRFVFCIISNKRFCGRKARSIDWPIKMESILFGQSILIKLYLAILLAKQNRPGFSAKKFIFLFKKVFLFLIFKSLTN